jgi:hypothetical protein
MSDRYYEGLPYRFFFFSEPMMIHLGYEVVPKQCTRKLENQERNPLLNKPSICLFEQWKAKPKCFYEYGLGKGSFPDSEVAP